MIEFCFGIFFLVSVDLVGSQIILSKYCDVVIGHDQCIAIQWKIDSDVLRLIWLPKKIYGTRSSGAMDSLRMLLCHADWINKRMIVVCGGLLRSINGR